MPLKAPIINNSACKWTQNTHTHTQQLCVFCLLFCFCFFESTNNKPNRQAATSQAQWQKALAGLSTCTPAGLKPRHLFWGPPRSQTGALPLTHHHPWGLGHNRVWKACSNSDTLSLIRLDNYNNSFIHSHDAAVTANILGAATNWGEVATQSPFKCQKVLLLLCVCVYVFWSLFPWHQSAHHPDSLRSHGLCMYYECELRMGKREREREELAGTSNMQ